MASQTRDSSGLRKEDYAPSATKPLPPAEQRKSDMSPGKKLTGEVATFETDEYGFITSWSQKAEQVYGYEYNDIVGKHLASLYTAGDLLHGKLIHELRAVESRGAYFTFGWQKRVNEQEFWSYAECEAIKDPAGGLVGYRKFVLETPSSVQNAVR